MSLYIDDLCSHYGKIFAGVAVVYTAIAISSLSRDGPLTSGTLFGFLYLLHPMVWSQFLNDEVDYHLVENLVFALAIAAISRKSIIASVITISTSILLSPLQGLCLLMVTVPLFLMGSKQFHFLNLGFSLMCALLCSAVVVYRTSCTDVELVEGLHLLSFNALSRSPELSLAWYLFYEVFLRYLPYFVTALWVYAFCYPFHFAVRFKDFPYTAAVLTLGIATVLDPSSSFTTSRIPLLFALFLCRINLVERMKNVLFWFGLQSFALFVSPFLKYLWLDQRSGNINLLFNQQIVIALAGGTLLSEFALAQLREIRDRRDSLRSSDKPKLD